MVHLHRSHFPVSHGRDERCQVLETLRLVALSTPCSLSLPFRGLVGFEDYVELSPEDGQPQNSKLAAKQHASNALTQELFYFKSGLRMVVRRNFSRKCMPHCYLA